jgi:hypothetical protein
MAVINRCAIAVAPKPPMREWSRPFWTREEMESIVDEQSLYLIPTYDDDAAALALVRGLYEEIFAAELDLWCVDRNLWPAPRTFSLFEQWFSLSFFPLVDDLGLTPLGTYGIGDVFRTQVQDALA